MFLTVDGGEDDVNVHCSLLRGIFYYLEGGFLPVDGGGDDVNVHYALLSGILHYVKGGFFVPNNIR